MTFTQLLLNSCEAGKRRCSCCKELKELSSFSMKNKAKGWLETRCKSCKVKQTIAYRTKKHVDTEFEGW